MHRLGDRTSTFAEVLTETWTDAVVVLHDGRIVLERYWNGMTQETPHLLMSVTKSVVGCVAGILVGQGLLDPDQRVSSYVPEIAGSGYGGATVRHLLDMPTGVAFREEYTDRDAEVVVMERWIGWRPCQEGDGAGGMYSYLTTLGKDTDHGGPFVYRSADTDMLGWVCERAAGTRMADLISLLVWQPMGAEFDAEINCDRVGSAIHEGGMSARARDLARFGQLMLDAGQVGETPVVPEGLAPARSHARPGHPGRLPRLRLRALPPRRLVPRPVLVRARAVGRSPVVLGHPRSTGAGGPRHPHPLGQVVVLADGSLPTGTRKNSPSSGGRRRRVDHSSRRSWRGQAFACWLVGCCVGVRW